jgi:hypothetical protein
MERAGTLLTSRCAGACLAALLLLAAAGCGRHERPAPSLVGERLDEAIAVLDRVGLDYDTNGGGLLGPIVKSRWVVCRQDPAPGAQTKPSAWHVCAVDPSDYVYVGESSISLYVARICPPPTVPELVGRPLTAALDVVRDFTPDVHVTTVRGRRVDPRRPRRWIVCSQDPEAGDDWLDHVLGAGEPPSFSLVVNLQCTAPDVVGMRLARATAVLHAGAIQVITVPFDSGAEPDRGQAVVCGQDPQPGETFDDRAGAPLIELYVAQRC